MSDIQTLYTGFSAHIAAALDALEGAGTLPAGLNRAAITLALIGPRLTDAAGQGWAAIACAETPAEAPLLALAQRLCQEASGSDGIVETLGKQPEA